MIIHVDRCIILFDTFLQVFTSLIIAILLISFLILINWKIALLIIFVFTFSYLLISRYIRTTLLKNSKKIGDLEEDILQDIQESLGSIRDIILSSKYHLLIKKYSQLDQKLRITKSQNIFLTSFPRYILESMGLLVMSFCILIFTIIIYQLVYFSNFRCICTGFTKTFTYTYNKPIMDGLFKSFF